jgi:hypothetical protein
MFLADAVSELNNAGQLAIQIAQEATAWTRSMGGIYLATLAILLISMKAVK